MEDNIIAKFKLHRRWIETIGSEGEKLRLDGGDLRSIDLSNKLLEQAILVDCNFDNLKLNDLDFHLSVLCSSTYRGGNLKRCDFYKTDLGYTNFSNASIEDIRFSKSDCYEAVFKNVTITNCNFTNTYFYLTDFSNATLNNLDISMATFEETIMNGTHLKNIKGVEEADFISINVGTLQKPVLLKSDNAKKWILKKCLYE